MRLITVTFGYLADPVIIDLTVPIVPVPPIVRLDLCTMFVGIVIVWFSKAPVLIIKLGQSFGKYT